MLGEEYNMTNNGHEAYYCYNQDDAKRIILCLNNCYAEKIRKAKILVTTPYTMLNNASALKREIEKFLNDMEHGTPTIFIPVYMGLNWNIIITSIDYYSRKLCIRSNFDVPHEFQKSIKDAIENVSKNKNFSISSCNQDLFHEKNFWNSGPVTFWNIEQCINNMQVNVLTLDITKIRKYHKSLVENPKPRDVEEECAKYPEKLKTIEDDDQIFLYLSALSWKETKEEYKAYAENEGWKFLMENDQDAGDYRGVCFINTKKRIMVIAHRGTYINPTGHVPSEENILADYLIATGKLPKTLLESAFCFCEDVQKEAEKRNCIVYQTGFSLGGWLAGMCGAYFEKKYPMMNGLTISIDSPGTLPAAISLIEKDELADNTENTIDYVIRPINLVSTCGKRMTKEVRELATATTNTESVSPLSQIDFNSESDILHLFQITGLLQSHNLDLLISWCSKEAINKKLNFKKRSQYLIRDVTIQKSDKSFNLKQFILHHCANAASTTGQFASQIVSSLSEKTSTEVCILAFLLVGTFIFIKKEEIHKHANIVLSKTNEEISKWLKIIEPYHNILEKLHSEYEVSGISLGVQKFASLQYDWNSLQDESEIKALLENAIKSKDLVSFKKILSSKVSKRHNEYISQSYFFIAKTHSKMGQDIEAYFNYTLAEAYSSNPAKIKKPTIPGCTPLNWNCFLDVAVEEGELHTVQYIIEKKLNCNNQIINTALINAAKAGRLLVVSWLLEIIGIASDEPKAQAFYLAVKNRHYDVAACVRQHILQNNMQFFQTVSSSPHSLCHAPRTRSGTAIDNNSRQEVRSRSNS